MPPPPGGSYLPNYYCLLCHDASNCTQPRTHPPPFHLAPAGVLPAAGGQGFFFLTQRGATSSAYLRGR